MDSGVRRFGQVEFDAGRGSLSVGGLPVELDRSCIAILALLLGNAGEDIDKDRLLEAGWPGRVVHENSLAKAIGRLRQALGADGAALETVHGYGYRLAAEIESGAAAASSARPLVRGFRSRRAAVAFAGVTIAALGAWGVIALSSGGPRQVAHGEPADSLGRILWVDDHPENNLAEKRFLEEHKIGVYQVATTEDALTLLRMYAYGAVVSDMGRGDRPLAGIDLLKAMRARGDRRPFFLYTVYSSDAQRKLIADSGGQGVAVAPDELHAAILPLFGAVPAEE